MTAEVRKDPFLLSKEPRGDEPVISDDAHDDAVAKSPEAFRTIGEAASELGLKTHVLRFWETKFDNLTPLKRPDGRRYYRPEDMEVLRTLQSLLHVQGLTIRGAVKALSGVDTGADDGEELTAPEGAAETGAANASVRGLQDAVRDAVERGAFRAEDEPPPAGDARARLESLLEDLSSLKSRLDRVRSAA